MTEVDNVIVITLFNRESVSVTQVQHSEIEGSALLQA